MIAHSALHQPSRSVVYSSISRNTSTESSTVILNRRHSAPQLGSESPPFKPFIKSRAEEFRGGEQTFAF
ncbi:uncharacterized [Tachysurus ichikawai]